MKQVIKDKLKKKNRKEKFSFFKQFKKSKQEPVVGVFESDFNISLNDIFEEYSIIFYNEDYKSRYVKKLWTAWSEKINEALKDILLDEIAKRYYNLDDGLINEQLIKRYYLNHLNQNKKTSNEEDANNEQPSKINESDISIEQLKVFWLSFYKSLILILGIEKTIKQDIILENVQKKWF